MGSEARARRPPLSPLFDLSELVRAIRERHEWKAIFENETVQILQQNNV
jgi:hypothetical protein